MALGFDDGGVGAQAAQQVGCVPGHLPHIARMFRIHADGGNLHHLAERPLEQRPCVLYINVRAIHGHGHRLPVPVTPA